MTERAEIRYPGDELEALADLPNYQAWIAALFGPALRGRLVEVGAGIGNVSSALRRHVQHATLIEPDPRLAVQLSERFSTDPGVTCFRGTVRDALLGGTVRRGEHDAVALVNVLEHVVDDAAMLTELRPLLASNGALLLFVPALQTLHGALDRSVGHVRRYTRRTLARVVTSAGYSVERLHYVDFAGVVPWFIYGRVLQRTSFDGRMASLYDTWAVPAIARIERALVPPIGKNLVCVARAVGG